MIESINRGNTREFTKSENDLIETLISNETTVNCSKNNIELCQKLSDGNIIVISRKTVPNTIQKKVKKITTINIIEESHDSEVEEYADADVLNSLLEDAESYFKSKNEKGPGENKLLRKKKKKGFKRANPQTEKPNGGIKHFNRKNKNSQIDFCNLDFRKEIKKMPPTTFVNSNMDNINNFDHLVEELKPANECEIIETYPDSNKQFDIQSIYDSNTDNRKIRVTRSKIKDKNNNLYFLSQLNDVKYLGSMRIRSTEIKTDINK